jgi:ribosomal protein S27E
MSAADPESKLIKVTSRDIGEKTTYYLFAQTAGRCEICNDYLIEHHVTGDLGNYAQRGHIYAFKTRGPRGNEPRRPADIHHVSNLILLCHKCHKLVDVERPDDFPVQRLQELKAVHEERVFELTAITENKKRVPMILRGLVAGREMHVSAAEIRDAVLPSYPSLRDQIDIDLSPIPDTPEPTFWRSCTQAIDAQLDRLKSYDQRYPEGLRLSVFAIAPIPLLMYLGSRLSDKTDVELYQRHRNPETWRWHDGDGTAQYRSSLVHDGEGDVALLLNLSGANSTQQVFDLIGKHAKIYELTLADEKPSPLFLNTRGDLERFRIEYERLLAEIIADGVRGDRLHVFSAIPAPIAITCGRARLAKVAPAMTIYDRDKRSDGFIHTMDLT